MTQTKAERILLKILRDNKGRTLTVDEIRELSKLDKYHDGKTRYSQIGISTAFIHNTIVNLNNQIFELLCNEYFWLIKDYEFNEEGLSKITTYEDAPKRIIFQNARANALNLHER